MDGTQTQARTSRLLRSNASDLVKVLERLTEIEEPVKQAAMMVGRCLTGGGKLIVCGNGGSAADSSHFATEFVCRYQDDRKPFPAIALSDSAGTVTATGNDYQFEQIFARQIRAFARPGDVLAAFTTSGKSPNIVAALKATRECGIESIGFLGRDGGACKGLSTVELIVPGTQVTARIQEVHKFLLHLICESVEDDLKKM